MSPSSSSNLFNRRILHQSKNQAMSVRLGLTRHLPPYRLTSTWALKRLWRPCWTYVRALMVPTTCGMAIINSSDLKMSLSYQRRWQSYSTCKNMSFILRTSDTNAARFFLFYHPFLPFLDRERSPEDYYNTSPLLFWTIISVGARRYQGDSHLLNSLAGPVSRLVWSTLADIPQSYHVVQALCLLCTWPFPTSSTSTDPTFMLCGMMMQVAMQLGLHRPSHTQDFSKFTVELIEEELRDKVRTWAICNIVAQRYVLLFLPSDNH